MKTEVSLIHDQYGLEIIEKGLELYYKQKDEEERQKVKELVEVQNQKAWILEVVDQVKNGLSDLE